MGLKGSEQTVRAGGRAGWAEGGTGRETPPRHCGCSELRCPALPHALTVCSWTSPPFPSLPFIFLNVYGASVDDDGHEHDSDGADDVIIFWGQHFVVERALAVETGLNSNPSSFLSQLSRSANGFTFLSLCFFICKVGAVMPVSQDLAGGPSDTVYLKAASVLAGLQ